MNNMITSQFKDLSEFMIKHSSKANNQAPSHTRIADTTTNIYLNESYQILFQDQLYKYY